MIDSKTRKEVIEFLDRCGGKNECGLTWGQIAERFNLRPTEAIKKALSDLNRYYKKTGRACPVDDSIPEGFEVVAIYGSRENPMLSLRKIKDESIKADDIKKAIDSLSKFSPKVEKINYATNKARLSIAYEIPVQDFHFGREDINVAAKKYLDCVLELARRVVGSYHVEKFIFPVGNDLFNTDGIKYTTTKGTPQFDYNPWHETFEKGSKAVISAITVLSNIAPVQVVMVQGNHDFERNFYLGCTLAAWFRNNKNVTVDNEFKPFKFIQHGQCMIMYEHGELKPADYPIIMATEQPQMFSETKFRETHTGHFHKEMIVDEARGVKTRFIPSIAPNSTWEKYQGYANLKIVQGFKWHRTHGLIGIEQVNDIN